MNSTIIEVSNEYQEKIINHLAQSFFVAFICCSFIGDTYILGKKIIQHEFIQKRINKSIQVYNIITSYLNNQYCKDVEGNLIIENNKPNRKNKNKKQNSISKEDKDTPPVQVEKDTNNDTPSVQVEKDKDTPLVQVEKDTNNNTPLVQVEKDSDTPLVQVEKEIINKNIEKQIIRKNRWIDDNNKDEDILNNESTIDKNIKEIIIKSKPLHQMNSIKSKKKK